MHVKQWFGRLDAHCSQLDEIRAALNDPEYNHPWCEPTLAAEIAVAGEPIYGPVWKFDPTLPSTFLNIFVSKFIG